MERAALVAEGAINRVEPDQGQDISAIPWGDVVKLSDKNFGERRDLFIN